MLIFIAIQGHIQISVQFRDEISMRPSHEEYFGHNWMEFFVCPWNWNPTKLNNTGIKCNFILKLNDNLQNFEEWFKALSLRTCRSFQPATKIPCFPRTTIRQLPFQLNTNHIKVVPVKWIVRNQSRGNDWARSRWLGGSWLKKDLVVVIAEACDGQSPFYIFVRAIEERVVSQCRLRNQGVNL